MTGFFVRWLVNISAMILVINIVPGIHSEGRLVTVMAALVLGLINATLRPILFAFTLPLTILSLGIFTLFMNGFCFYLVSKIVEGFTIVDFQAAFWGALCFSVVSFLLNLFISPQGRFKVYRHESRNRPHDPNVIDVDAEVEDAGEEDKDGEK